MLAHAVYFTLKDRSPAAVERLVAACREDLAGHEGEASFAVGTCADYDRHVNDRDWDVMLLIVFESRAAHDRYQKAPRHVKFIAAQAPNWAKVRVFDADVPAAGE
jgi:quinol monooxygenase YgiN